MQPTMPIDPEADFGVLMAPVNGRGTWAALKELRAALRSLRPGRSGKVLFVDALDGEGKAVALHDPGVAALVLGYRFTTSTNGSDPNKT
ncbi:MAG: hypothetical protein ACRD1T_16095 [Acidimicrobiia bacterium]